MRVLDSESKTWQPASRKDEACYISYLTALLGHTVDIKRSIRVTARSLMVCLTVEGKEKNCSIYLTFFKLES